MNCKKCGYILTENDRFCKNCGTSVNEQVEQNYVQQSMNNNFDFMQQSVNSNSDFIQPSMNNNSDFMQQSMNNNSDFMQQSMNSNSDFVQQSMNNNSDFMQQTMNSNSDFMQQSVSNIQPMNTYQQNYSNNNQNSWQNNYNSMPNYQTKKNNNNGMFIGIGIAVSIVIVGIIIGMNFFDNNENNNYSSENSNGNEIFNNTNSTYSVKFKGFKFKIPVNLIYNTDSNALYIGDEEDTWQAAIEVVSGSFNQLQINKNNLISVYQRLGYGAANLNQKIYGGLDFITIELTNSGQNAILGFTKANSMYLFGATIYNLDNDFDYNLLSNVSQVLSSAEYFGETNNISGFSKVDMGPVSGLAK